MKKVYCQRPGTVFFTVSFLPSFFLLSDFTVRGAKFLPSPPHMAIVMVKVRGSVRQKCGEVQLLPSLFTITFYRQIIRPSWQWIFFRWNVHVLACSLFPKTNHNADPGTYLSEDVVGIDFLSVTVSYTTREYHALHVLWKQG